PAAGRDGHLHRRGPAAGHGDGLGAGAPDRRTDEIRPVPVAGHHPGPHLRVGGDLRDGRRPGQRAGRAPSHRPTRHGGRLENQGMRTMKKKSIAYTAVAVVAVAALMAWAFAPRPVEVEVAAATRGVF